MTPVWAILIRGKYGEHYCKVCKTAAKMSEIVQSVAQEDGKTVVLVEQTTIIE